MDASGSPLLALGWATVELERAASELGTDLRLPAGSFADAEGSTALGARCWIAPGALNEGVTLILLEPSTEGRLAARLARFGEGVAAAWYAAGDESRGGRGLPGRGPLGPEWRILDAPTASLLRFLVAPEPGTIAR